MLWGGSVSLSPLKSSVLTGVSLNTQMILASYGGGKGEGENASQLKVTT